MSDDLAWLRESVERILAMRSVVFEWVEDFGENTSLMAWQCDPREIVRVPVVRLGRWQRFCAWFRRSKVPMARTVRR